MSEKIEREILLSSTGSHDLRAVQFSRRGAFLCVLEDDEDRSLYLSLSRSPDMWMQRKNLVRIAPTAGHVELPYEYEVEPGRLVIRTDLGDIEMCLDEQGRLRVRGQRVGLRFSFRMQEGENAYMRADNEWEICYTIIGRLLFVALRGALCGNALWDPSRQGVNDFALELLPCAVTGKYEAAIHESVSNIVRPERYEAFDACVEDAVAQFDRFCKRFPPVAEADERMARLAAWVIWIHTLGPSGLLKHSVVYMTRTQWLRAFGWQQSFHAMAASTDINEAWALLQTMFDYQDEAGQIPDSIGDIGAAYMVTKPALQGLAFEYLLKRHSLADVPVEARAGLYDALSRFADWWLTCRDRNSTGLPQYHHADESPGEFCTCFRDGLPIHSGDLTAFLVLLTEACARLAESLGQDKETSRWAETSSELCRRLSREGWDGNRFVFRVVKTGKTVDSGAILGLLPIILGKRLPRSIIDKITERLMDEQEYLLPGGIAIENVGYAADLEQTPGPHGAPAFVNTLICIGLMSAGKEAEALEIANRCLRVIREQGFGFMASKRQETQNAQEATLPPRRKRPQRVDRWSSWTAACFIILANMLWEYGQE